MLIIYFLKLTVLFDLHLVLDSLCILSCVSYLLFQIVDVVILLVELFVLQFFFVDAPVGFERNRPREEDAPVGFERKPRRV